MLIILKTIARTLILPPAGFMIIAVMGLLLIRRRPKLATTLIAAAVVSLWLCATPVVADTLARAVEHYPPLDLKRPLRAQAIVVIGGGSFREKAPEYGGPAADRELLERLSYTAYIARRTSLPVLVSGDGMEAITMQTSLARDFGVKTRWVEHTSRDTFENARNSAQLLRADGVKRIVLITSSTHLWRATHEFSSAGFEVVPAPVGMRGSGDERFAYLPTPYALMRSHYALYEMMGEPVREVFAMLHVRRQSP